MKRRGSRARTFIGVAISIAFAGFIVFNSFHAPNFQCEVCITFGERSACRTVEGATETEARASAVNNACALLAQGVTDTIACERTTPTHVNCTPL